MKQKVITGLLLVILLAPALIFGGIPFYIVMALFLFIGGIEIATIYKDQWPQWMLLVVIGLVFGVAITPGNIFLAMVMLLVMSLLSLTVFFKWFSLDAAMYLLGMLILVGLTVRGILLISNVGSLVIVYVAVATYMTDTLAYFVGMSWGKHRLAPLISPKKSIEGAVGGYISGLLSSLLYGYFVLANIFPLHFLLITAFMMPLVGQIGDLVFSSIKRHYNVKDFGSLFPAHGGVLDRIDSLIFNFMFFYACMVVLL